MKNQIFLASMLLCLGGRLAMAQSPEQATNPRPSPPTSPGNVNELTTDLSSPFFASPPQVAVEEPSPNTYRMWAKVDYLMWWLKPVCLKPPTLTVGSPDDAVPGALGQPHTDLVMGEHKFEFGGASGIRPTVGIWLTDDQFLSWETDGFLLEQVAANQSFQSHNGSPAAYIPFQDSANVNQALPFSIPGVVDANAIAVGRSRLWGIESDLAAHFSTTRSGYVLSGALVGGFRYLNLEDQVTATNEQNLVSNPSVFAVGSDHFETRNQFYGAQLGSTLGLSRGNWSLEMDTKLALGDTHQVSEVSGQPLSAGAPVSSQLLPGPVLVLPSNTGKQSADRITLVPEMAFTLHYALTQKVGLSLGYSCLYWNKVLCPGDQMDNHLNVTQLPLHGPLVGPGLPAPLFVHTDAFAQGLNVGLEVRY